MVYRRLNGHSSIVGVVNAIQETPSSDQIDANARHYLHKIPQVWSDSQPCRGTLVVSSLSTLIEIYERKKKAPSVP